MINQKGIEANPKKIASIEMKSQWKPNEVQSLIIRWVVALSHFIFKATNKYLPFFKVLKWEKKFQWTEYVKLFQRLKKNLR